MYLNENELIIDEIRVIFDKVIDKYLKGKYINWNEYKF